MPTILKVNKVVGDYKGFIKLDNGYVKLHVPKRSSLLNGKKLVKGESYEITLKPLVKKKPNNPTRKKSVKKK